MEAEHLLTKVEATFRNRGNFTIRWEPGFKAEALKLARQNGLTGYKGGCPACELQLLNKIRELAGYGPVQHEDKSLRDRRLKICRGCEHYKKITRSCGTLILGAITAKKNEPCGCYLPIKASFKIFNCPLNKWKDEDSKN